MKEQDKQALRRFKGSLPKGLILRNLRRNKELQQIRRDKRRRGIKPNPILSRLPSHFRNVPVSQIQFYLDDLDR